MSRLLLDANVSPALAEALRWRGHDAVHVNEIGLRTAPDRAIFRAAAALGRTVVTHDDDYLRLLRRGGVGPSVIHLCQRELQRDPVVGRLAQALALGEVLHAHGDCLARGAAVRVGRSTSWVDPLPLGRGRSPRAVAGLAGPERMRVRELPGPVNPGPSDRGR